MADEDGESDKSDDVDADIDKEELENLKGNKTIPDDKKKLRRRWIMYWLS